MKKKKRKKKKEVVQNKKNNVIKKKNELQKIRKQGLYNSVNYSLNRIWRRTVLPTNTYISDNF